MIWGYFSGHGGRSSLFFLPKNETMNTDKYMGCAGGQALPLDADAPCVAVTAGRGALPQGQAGDGPLGQTGLHRHGLARQFTGSQPHQEPLVNHEEEAEGQPHHPLHAPPPHRHQEDVGD